MSRYFKVGVVFVLVMMLAGCLSPSISITVKPDPIKFKFGETSKDITVTFKTSGFGKIKLETLAIQLLDDQEDEVLSEEVELDKDTYVVPFISFDVKETVELPSKFKDLTEEEYEIDYKGKTYSLIISVTGDKPVVAEVDVIFE
ncbi:MAG: hypothetical protein GX020_04255 [Firmicutes bacterium]|nr:hypothetical protein [Bacillota bacterium]